MATILLVEPNYVLAATYQAALEHEGFTVYHAFDAQEAIDAADVARPDAVVVELQLAGHDGVEFLHEFRSYNEWVSIPAIIHSNVTPMMISPLMDALRQDLGVRQYLYKPHTTLPALLRSVRELTS